MIPVIPYVIRSLSRTENEFNYLEFEAAVQQEPSVSAKLIGYANSPAFRTHKPIVSIHDAIIRLGLTHTKTVVLSLLVRSKLDISKCSSFKMDKYWYDTMIRARYAKCLALELNNKSVDIEQIYCLALVSGIGILLLASQCPEVVSEIIANDTSHLSITERIRNQFHGKSQYYYGAELLSHWGLPPIYKETIKFIDIPSYKGEYRTELSLLQAARKLSNIHNKLDQQAVMNEHKLSLDSNNILNITKCVNQELPNIRSLSTLLK